MMILAMKNNEKNEVGGGHLPFSLVYRQGGIKHRLKGFLVEDTVYFCIPGNLSLEKMSLDMEAAESLLLDGRRLQDGDTLSRVELNRVYEAVYSDADRSDGESDGGTSVPVVFMQGSRLPVICLTTASGSMEAVNADKEYSEAGFMEVYGADGNLETAVKVERLSGRGNTSWDAAKKSYAVKLADAEDILGMGAEKTWVLCANYYDGAYIRNQIGFEIARESGMQFTPEERFVELYINDEYAGLYQIMEKIKISKNRVDIGNDYLLEVDYIERSVGEPYILLGNEQPVVVHEPEKDCDLESVQRFFDAFTTAMENGNTAEAMDRLDVESFAKRFVMEEILQDMDFGYTSQYLYLDLKNGILHDGPLWDLDNTMGRGIAVEAQDFFVTDYDLSYNNVSRMFAVFYSQPEFRKLVWKEYTEHFRPAMLTLLEGGIEEKTAAIEASIAMDQILFPAPRSVFMTDASLEEHTAHLIGYLQDKLHLMDEYLCADLTDTVMETVLPETEVKEIPPDMMPVQEAANSGEHGIVYYLMNYRFLAVLLVMCGGGMLLWYRCRKTGK
ncbi:MAG: CotH kinase family protein [Lachnospiraceae bacterium]|nr:CotH kinase family protein [Lachnospiraceae bacterium]